MSDLSAVLAAGAARHPHRPWIFFPEGWDWRWRSWSWAAVRADALAIQLAARTATLGIPSWRGRVAAAVGPPVDRLLLDLALQRLGAVVAGGSPTATTVPTGAASYVVTPGPDGDLAVTATGAGEPVEGGPGAQVLVGGQGRFVAAGELLEAAMVLDRRLAGRRPRREPVEVVVGTGELERLEERLVVAWSLVAGAALALVEPGRRVGAALWARPTVFAGPGEEVTALARALGEHGGGRWRRRRLPLGRLHGVVTWGETPAPEARRFFAERGVLLLEGGWGGLSGAPTGRGIC
jgi:hypothetical protein